MNPIGPSRRALLAALAAASGCTLRSSLPIYGTVPDFALIDQDGKPFSSHELAERIWLACFFFTTCNGPCPRMNSQFKQIQDQTEGLEGVRLLSITIDPKHDTPQELKMYARRFKADPRRWHFLTGTVAQLNVLSDDTFHLNQVQTPTLDHSTRFVLVDRKARIRGYYDSSDARTIPQVVEDIQKLTKELL